MMTMGPAFTPHPAAGMPQHPGGPGAHPMAAPGMAHNPSQPGAPPQGMPHQLTPHMAVSAPGGQMNAGPLVGGMPPGVGGPNAHAMSHLSPAQSAQMFHAQQNNMGAFAANNQMAQHMQQQQRLQILQQQQYMRLAQQQGHLQPGMAGMPMGMMSNVNLLTPAAHQAQQFAQMRARPNPQAQQAMIAQQVALQHQQQQQHAAANHQMAQQAGNPNQLQLNPQQLQGFQQAGLNVAQMQQLQLQAAAQAQQQQQQMQAQAQAQQAQGQAQGQGGHPPNQPQQPGQPQQNPQQQQGANGPGGNIQGQNQGQMQGPGPQANQPQQNQQQQPQQQQQQGQPQPQQGQQQQQQQGPSQAQQQAHQAHQLQQQNAMAQNIASQQAAMRQMRERELKGQCTLKLIQFSEWLSGFPGSKGKDDTQYWDKFVQNFFSELGVFRYTVPNTDEVEQPEKSYDITYHALPRYFHTQFDSGVKNIQLVMDRTTEYPPTNGRYVIDTNKASMITWFEGGSHVVATGSLRATLDSSMKIELLEFTTTGYEEYISRKLVIEAAKPAHNWVKDWHKVNTQPDNKQSPEMSKKGKARLMKSPQNPPPDLDLPHSVVKHNVGVTEAVHQFLEMVDIMGQMQPLFAYHHAHPGVPPYAALQEVLSIQQTQAQGQQNPAMMMNMGMANGHPPMQQGGPRTPSFGQFQMGQSPAQVHQMLPGSPHMGSPAPGQMQAPSMQLQASQQGTSSSGPSANTSPSQNNKRRRPSGVKNEEDGPASAPTPAAAGTPQLNGVQGKTKPPTPRMPKRVKGNPA